MEKLKVVYRNFNGITILLFFLFSCAENKTESEKTKTEKQEKTVVSDTVQNKKETVPQTTNTTLINELVDIQEINSDILVELKYATSDNFMGIKLYSRTTKAFLQKDVALRLSAAQKMLDSLKPGYRLLVYDALRPVSVQRKMWNALDSIPVEERGKFVSNPNNRSLHNMGAAVDLTVVNERGIPLDMGAGYDDIRKIAYPSLESQFLASGELKPEHIRNRKLLRTVMEAQKFRQLQTEWWHFNACSRPEALKKYKVLLEEL